jgi:DNA repair protein RecO (recombination protein O)
MIVSSEAIVLKSMKYGDTSRIVTIYTRDFGKQSIIAKGARGKRSKFGSALEPMSHSHFVFYRKENRDLQLVSQADLITRYRFLIEDSARCVYGFLVIEYVNAIVQPDEAQPALFDLVRTALEQLDAAERNPENAFLRFLMDFSALLGFAIDFQHCTGCGGDLTGEIAGAGAMAFETLNGGFDCPTCAVSRGGAPVARDLFKSLQWIDHAEPGGFATLRLSKEQLHAALRILHLHIASHVHDLKEIRSYSLLNVFS